MKCPQKVIDLDSKKNMMAALADLARNTHDWLSMTTGFSRLPQRIQAGIERQQQNSEILVGWIQLGILVVFAALYAASPKAFSPQASFEPVPWALGLYFFFTVLRLILAHRRAIPFWFLVLSVIVDMLLLLGLIWSFHLQYEQPASFYLKAPTLLYVFIFISLRALRFEPGFVVLAGVVAAMGWLLMAYYAIWVDPQQDMITQDYVHYLTSNSILLGAEVDKIISILLVTVILSIAIVRARYLLIRSVTGQTTADDLARFVPSAVASQIANAEQDIAVGQTVTREATILFIDLANFTAIGESLPPQELVNTLNQYFTAVAQPIETHGGVICQFQGDAILASFNLPSKDPDHAANALRAAQEIQRLLAREVFGNNNRLQARIGVTSGIVVGGLVGTPNRLGYTIHGNDVNLAARLEQLNKKTGTSILLSEHTMKLAGDKDFLFQRVGSETLRGQSTAITVYTIAANR